MTTSEQARAWAKAEAEKRWEGETIPQDARPFVAADNAGAEWGILHVLSLLESEQVVEAGATAIDEVPYVDFGEPAPSEVLARAALVAAAAAITNPKESSGV